MFIGFFPPLKMFLHVPSQFSYVLKPDFDIGIIKNTSFLEK